MPQTTTFIAGILLAIAALLYMLAGYFTRRHHRTLGTVFGPDLMLAIFVAGIGNMAGAAGLVFAVLSALIAYSAN